MDNTDAILGRLTFKHDTPDRNGRRMIRARWDGKEIHKSRLDPYIDPHRAEYCEAIYRRVPELATALWRPDGDNDLSLIGDRILSAADQSELPTENLAPSVTFPVDALPRVIGQFVTEASKSIGCNTAFVVLPLLVCLARAIGNKRMIRLKHDWKELPIIWAAIVGKSGTH